MSLPPIHNYEKQVVFSNRDHNFSPNDVINFTIATSSDNVYFNLYSSHITLKLKITGLTKNTSGAEKVFTVPVKKNMSGIINNSKVVYTYFSPEQDGIRTLTLNSDNEDTGMIRSILNTLTTNSHNNRVNEQLKELSYILYDDVQYGSDSNQIIENTKECARYLKRPYKGQLFFNELTFKQPNNSEIAYTTINIPFKDVFVGCGQEKFLNLCQMDAELILQDSTNYFYIDGGKINIRENYDQDITQINFSNVYIDTCELWYHNYKSNNDNDFDPEDCELAKNEILTKTFKIPPHQSFLDNSVICNFPIKTMYILFTNNEGDFSSLEDIKFKKINLNIAGEQKRRMEIDNSNNPDGIEQSLWEWMDYINNARADEYSTLLTYKTWRDQFKIYAFPLSEFFPMRSANQLQFEIQLQGDNAETLQMHMIFIRASQVIS